MFTGIIAATGRLADVQKTKGGLRAAIVTPKKWRVKKGDSITVNGVCSTAITAGKQFIVEWMPETMRRTTVETLCAGQIVNLEQSMTLNDKLDGHIVQGHVDAKGTIKKIISDGNSYVFFITYPKVYGKFLAEKGSVALEGISLTVVDVTKTFFTVKIIPYTWKHTNLHTKKSGDTVNLEFDVLMKYLARLIKK